MIRPTAAIAALLALAAVWAPITVAAQSDSDHDEIVAGGAWHYHSVPCTDARIIDVGPRLDPGHGPPFAKGDFSSGVAIAFSVPSGFRFMPQGAIPDRRVVHYQGDADNAVMQSERRGDRVQVCLMSFPLPRFDRTGHAWICNPDADPRGWTFRVYDYRRNVAFYGSNTQHSCGGA